MRNLLKKIEMFIDVTLGLAAHAAYTFLFVLLWIAFFVGIASIVMGLL